MIISVIKKTLNHYQVGLIMASTASNYITEQLTEIEAENTLRLERRVFSACKHALSSAPLRLAQVEKVYKQAVKLLDVQKEFTDTQKSIYELRVAALEKDGRSIVYIPQDEVTLDLCRIAVKENAEAMFDIDRRFFDQILSEADRFSSHFLNYYEYKMERINNLLEQPYAWKVTILEGGLEVANMVIEGKSDKAAFLSAFKKGDEWLSINKF